MPILCPRHTTPIRLNTLIISYVYDHNFLGRTYLRITTIYLGITGVLPYTLLQRDFTMICFIGNRGALIVISILFVLEHFEEQLLFHTAGGLGDGIGEGSIAYSARLSRLTCTWYGKAQLVTLHSLSIPSRYAPHLQLVPDA